MNSFARDVKSELARKEIKHPCCIEAEMKGFLEVGGQLLINSGKKSLVFKTGSASIARRIFSLVKVCLNVTPAVIYGQRKEFQKDNIYFIQAPAEAKVLSLLARLGFLPGTTQETPEALQKKCCRRAYLMGAFLAGGSLNHPDREYHLEIVFPAEEYASRARDILETFGLETRFFQRKGSFVIYLKGGDTVGEFLRIVGAHQALFEYENVRVVKGIRNRTNRLVNYETANLTRTAFAAHEQINNIKLIQEKIGLENIPSSLRQVARLRLRFPEETLNELGNKASPPLSKSSINHRMRRLKALAHKASEKGKQSKKQ